MGRNHHENQTFQAEQQLYQYTVQHFQALKQQWEDAGFHVYYPVTYKEKTLEQQQLVALGEAHCSIMAVEYIHEHLVPVIQQTPQSWLFLIERLHDKDLANPAKYPTGFYFRELADLFDISKDEALVDLYEADGRKKIEEKSGLTDRDIDELLLGQHLAGIPSDDHTILAAWYIARQNNRPMNPEFASYGESLAQDLAIYLKKPLQ